MSGCYCNPIYNGATSQPSTKIESYVKVVSGGLTDEERKKLAGIEENANNYKLPIASDKILGGFKVGSGLKMSEDGVLSVTGSTEDDDDSQIMDGGGSGGTPPDEDDVVIWDGGGASGV